MIILPNIDHEEFTPVGAVGYLFREKIIVTPFTGCSKCILNTIQDECSKAKCIEHDRKDKVAIMFKPL